MASTSTNAGSIQVAVVANTKPLESGFKRAAKSILGFNNFTKNMMKGFVGANVLMQTARLAKNLIMSSEEMQTLSGHIESAGKAFANWLLVPVRKAAKLINDIVEASKKIEAIGARSSKDTMTWFQQRNDPKLKAQMAKEAQVQPLIEARDLQGQQSKNILDEIDKREKALEQFRGAEAQFVRPEYARKEINRLTKEISFLNDQLDNFNKVTAGRIAEAEKTAKEAYYPNNMEKVKAQMQSYMSLAVQTFKDIFRSNRDVFGEKKDTSGGQFKSLDQIWEDAVSNALKGGRDDAILKANERTASAVEQINSKMPAGGGGLI